MFNVHLVCLESGLLAAAEWSLSWLFVSLNLVHQADMELYCTATRIARALFLSELR